MCVCLCVYLYTSTVYTLSAPSWSCESEGSGVILDEGMVVSDLLPGVLQLHCVPVAQWLEHCVSSAKVVGSIPREHTY